MRSRLRLPRIRTLPVLGIGLAALGLDPRDSHAVDPWNLDISYVGGARAEARWTVAEEFPGTKLILNARHSLRTETSQPSERACDCGPPSTRRKIRGTIGTHLQWGKGELGLEYGVLTLTWRATQRDYVPVEGSLQADRDTLEWGVLRLGKDDPLGIDSYAELTLARGSRTWAYSLRNSPWKFSFGFSFSAGYAWAESTEELFRDVSNMIIGTWGKGTVSRGRWGAMYIEQRVANGWAFSSPARAGTVSREAVARFGYTTSLRGCLDVELFAEKRSFNFTDPILVDLYTKSKRIGVELNCMFRAR